MRLPFTTPKLRSSLGVTVCYSRDSIVSGEHMAGMTLPTECYRETCVNTVDICCGTYVNYWQDVTRRTYVFSWQNVYQEQHVNWQCYGDICYCWQDVSRGTHVKTTCPPRTACQLQCYGDMCYCWQDVTRGTHVKTTCPPRTACQLLEWHRGQWGPICIVYDHDHAVGNFSPRKLLWKIDAIQDEAAVCLFG